LLASFASFLGARISKQNMTATQIIAKFRNEVDDQLDSEYELQLVNDAKDEIEAERDWEMLKNEQSYSIAAGSSYANTQALPTRFANDLRVVEGNSLEYRKISFEDRLQKVNGSSAYFLDMAAGTIGFAGSNLAAVTVYLLYTKYSADLTSGDSWAFPARFHKILAYRMAKLFYAADAGEKQRAWDDRWDAYEKECLASMELWDDRLKLRNRQASRTSNRENSVNL
jgi:hypothetical protein